MFYTRSCYLRKDVLVFYDVLVGCQQDVELAAPELGDEGASGCWRTLRGTRQALSLPGHGGRATAPCQGRWACPPGGWHREALGEAAGPCPPTPACGGPTEGRRKASGSRVPGPVGTSCLPTSGPCTSGPSAPRLFPGLISGLQHRAQAVIPTMAVTTSPQLADVPRPV